MAKPRLIILIRHAQSEGNKNRDIHQTIPDHRVKLTSEGWQQAYEAGRRLKAMLRPDDKLHFFTSPYRRTRETTEGILSTLTDSDSPFKRLNIKVYEEPRLREQDFGNFQPCSAEMERMWQERADYGHFFYRIPNGESAADAYDRISGFNESLWRQFGEDDFGSVCVLVTHGLMSRVFLMKWYHFTVEYFEDLRNVNHCEFLIMKKDDNGKYILQNKLRTWSELRRERLKEKEKETGKEQDGTMSPIMPRDAQKDATKLPRNKSQVVIRRWGGCPNGCDHSRNLTRNRDSEMLLLRQKDEQDAHKHSTELANAGRVNAAKAKPSSIKAKTPRTSGLEVAAEKVTNGDNIAAVTALSDAPTPEPQVSSQSLARPPLLVRRSTRRMYNSDDDDPNDPRELSSGSDPITSDDISGHLIHGASNIDINTRLAQEEMVSSPDATPSFISPEDRLRSMLSPELDNFDDPDSNNESSCEMVRPSTHGHGKLYHHYHHLYNYNYHKHPSLYVGRDGGGSYSGHTSLANTYNESSAGLTRRSVRQPQLINSLLARAAKTNARMAAARKVGGGGGGDGRPMGSKGVGSNNEDADDEEEDESDFVNSEDIVMKSGMGRGMKADRLGDGNGHEGRGREEEEEEDLDAAEKEDRSICGSVY